MRTSWQAADRAAELLAAARGWRAAGLIDEATLATIAGEHPAAGPQLGQLWRILVFLCVWVGVSTATALGFISFGVREAGGVGLTLLVFGLALGALTEVIVDRCSFRPTGAEAATSLLAAGYLCAGVYLLLDDSGFRGHDALLLTYPWCAAVFGLAAWRWGLRLYAGASVVFTLLFCTQLSAPRILWIGAAALIAAVLSAALARRELAPSHREGVQLARLTALAAIYVAVNYYSVDKRFLEELGRLVGGPHTLAGAGSRFLAGLGSALLPPAILLWGLRTRDRSLITLGIVTAALSLATIRFYVHLAPLWVVLAAAGAALTGASLLLERWLRAGHDAERRGYTAAPLADEARRERLLPVAAAIALAPAARAIPDEPPGVAGRGGSFGGGGAGGSF